MFVRVSTMLQQLREQEASHALERERWERERADLLDRLALSYGKPIVVRDAGQASSDDGDGWEPDESSPYPGPYDDFSLALSRLAGAGGM